MQTFELQQQDYIELNKLLKLVRLVNSGGEANLFIDEGEVLVNNCVENRKRKKLVKGDIVTFNGKSVEIK